MESISQTCSNPIDWISNNLKNNSLFQEEKICKLWDQAKPYLFAVVGTVAVSLMITATITGLVPIELGILAAINITTITSLAVIWNCIRYPDHATMFDLEVNTSKVELPDPIPVPEDLSEEAKKVYKLLQSYTWRYDPRRDSYLQTDLEDKKALLFQERTPFNENDAFIFNIIIEQHDRRSIQECELEVLDEGVRVTNLFIERRCDRFGGNFVMLSFDPEENKKYLACELNDECQEDVVLQILSIIYSHSYFFKDGTYADRRREPPYLMTQSDIAMPRENFGLTVKRASGSLTCEN